jgi:HPt (histidine-containing phosphotransfer) domain-containing protein
MASSLPSSPDQPIKFGEVLERVGGDIPFLRELLNIYFSEFVEKRALLERAVEGNDFRLIRELGHSLKGSSANLSLPSLQKSAQALELSGREEREDAVRLALQSLDVELLRLRKFLETNPLS